MSRLRADSAILVVIDVQGKLHRVIHDNQILEDNVVRLVRGAHVLGVPSIATEQYPKGIGPTTSPIRQAFEDTIGFDPIQKMCFSSMGSDTFTRAVERSGRRQIIICGIEAHVCVYQTTIDMLEAGYQIYLVGDAVSSRTERNRDLAIDRLTREGALLSSTEMALFEMTIESGTETFKAISKLVK